MNGSEEPIVLCESCSHSLTTYPYFEPSGSRMNAELRSKYAPVDSEIASVRNDIQRAVELELDPLNKEIQRLRDLLEHLNGRKEIVEEYVRQKQAILVPIRLLPFEILVHIFEYLCQDNTFGVEKRDISIPGWTLTRVCKAWRDLALTTPQLWSRITILLDPRNPVTYASFNGGRDVIENALKSFLFNSDDYDLHISILPRPNPNGSPAYLEGPTTYREGLLIRQLVQHSHRWASLTFTPGSYKFSNVDASRLRQLHIIGDPHRIFGGAVLPLGAQMFLAQNQIGIPPVAGGLNGQPPPAAAIPTFQAIQQHFLTVTNAPVAILNVAAFGPGGPGGQAGNAIPLQLYAGNHDLSLRFSDLFSRFSIDVTGLDLAGVSCLERFPVPWCQLVHVTLLHATMADIWSLGRLHPNIQHLTIRDPYYRNIDSFLWGTTFELLETLELVDIFKDPPTPVTTNGPPPDVVPDPRALGQILSALTTPSLTKLVVGIDDDAAASLHFPLIQFTDFVARSTPNLLQLELRHVTMKVEELYEVISNFPLLESLTLGYCSSDSRDIELYPAFIECLNVRSAESILSNLSLLRLMGEYFSVDDPFIAFLESRARSLASVHLWFEDEPSFDADNVLERLGVLAELGMKICFNGDWEPWDSELAEEDESEDGND